MRRSLAGSRKKKWRNNIVKFPPNHQKQIRLTITARRDDFQKLGMTFSGPASLLSWAESAIAVFFPAASKKHESFNAIFMFGDLLSLWPVLADKAYCKLCAVPFSPGMYFLYFWTGGQHRYYISISRPAKDAPSVYPLPRLFRTLLQGNSPSHHLRRKRQHLFQHVLFRRSGVVATEHEEGSLVEQFNAILPCHYDCKWPQWKMVVVFARPLRRFPDVFPAPSQQDSAGQSGFGHAWVADFKGLVCHPAAYEYHLPIIWTPLHRGSLPMHKSYNNNSICQLSPRTEELHRRSQPG